MGWSAGWASDEESGWRDYKYREQTVWLQECDMPHSQSVSLCLLESEFSTPAKALERGGSEGLSNKKAYLQSQHQKQVAIELRLNTYLLS